MAATLYGVGKTFFWPTTLGVVSEQYPKGGALMLNAIAGVGMIAVGTIGNPAIGYLQDRQFDQVLLEEDPALHEQVVTSASGMFGDVNRPNPKMIGGIRQRHAEVVEAGKGNIAFVDNMTPEQIESSLLETLALTDEQKQTYQETRDQLEIIDRIDRDTKQGTLASISVLPAIMFLCYVGLIIYFRSKGGYKAQVLTGHAAEDEEFTGGVEGPVE